MDAYKGFLRVWINPMSRRIGRPIEPARPGERATLTLRVTADIKSRLEAEATKNARSLSQEAELRLEMSFDREASVAEALRQGLPPLGQYRKPNWPAKGAKKKAG
jgi:hypothetical protein